MKQELRGCPFCGELPEIEQEHSLIWCSKADCVASSVEVYGENIDDAIAAWNTRSDQRGESTEMIQCETLTTEIDWEQRKWDACVAIVAAYKGSSDTDTIEWKNENMVRAAISTADELINQLKQKSDENN